MATGATGSAYFISFDGVTISTNYRSTGMSEDIGIVDQSSGADANRTYLTTLKDGTLQTAGKHAAGDTAVWGKLVPGTEGTLHWGEEGSVAGKPSHYANAIVTNRSRDASYDDLIVISAQFQYSGAVVDGTY
jgi:hypothetical protein